MLHSHASVVLLDYTETTLCRPFPLSLTNPPGALSPPLSLQVLGRQDMRNIIRLQLAYMEPHTKMRIHQDAGGYALQVMGMG